MIGKALQYLIQINAWNPATSSVKTLYVGTQGFTTQPGDTPANVYFEPYVRSALRRRASLYRRRQIGGQAVPARGVVQIELCDVTRPWRNLYFGGRSIKIWLGEVGAAFSAHQVVFTGFCGERAGGIDTIEIPIVDGKKRFEVPIQPLKWAGTGGANGNEYLTDKTKGIALGHVENVTPQLLDRATSLYGVGTPINAMFTVMDRGIALTQVGGTPAGGQYSVNLAAGTFTLGYAPLDADRDITATFQGWKPPIVGYQASVAMLIKAIAKDVVGLVDADLDLASFAALEAAQSAPIGLWLPQGGQCDEVIDRICDSFGAWWTFGRDGKLRVGRLEAPTGSPVASFVQGDLVLNGMRPLRMDEAAWKQTLKFRPNWTIQSTQDLAGGSTFYSRDKLNEPFRNVTAFDNAILTAFPDAVAEQSETLILFEWDAADEVARRLALYGTRRDVLEVQVLALGFERDLGDEISITHPDWGTINGIVIGVDDVSRLQQSTLEVWY